VVLIALLYLGLRSFDVSTPGNANDTGKLATPVQAPPPETPSRERATISVGSPLGEVYAIQGVPTAIQGETWYYGKSLIQFSQGKAISWIEDPGYPLRVVRSGAPQSPNRHFDIGSTKEEVRAIQGPPITETDNVWDYAPSRVYFERNRVVRWEDSPLQPLRIPR